MSTNAPGPGELPPPAYCEQEYDRKTANAIELSLATSTQHQPEEEWEVWDEAMFEAALRAQEPSPRPTSNAGSNSSSVRALPSIPQPSTSNTPHTQTLPAPRVDEKKSMSKVPAQSVKPRPSWFDEAGLADSSTGSSSGSTYSRYTSSSNTGSSSDGFHPRHLMVHNFTSADEEDYAPPPFSPNNSSAPAFGAIPVGDVITLSYNGRSSPNHISRLGPPPGTPPPSSRLVFPGTPEPAPPTPNPSSSDRPLLQVEPLRPRASSNIHTPSYNIVPPVRMGFDPNVAYPKNLGLVEKQNAPPSPSTPIDVLSLYNSSVSAVLESSSQRFNRPQVARNTTSPGMQNTHFPSYFSPPVSPRPMYAPVTPPPLSNQNATQFPLQPSFTPDLSSYQYQSRWASSEQQFSHFR